MEPFLQDDMIVVSKTRDSGQEHFIPHIFSQRPIGLKLHFREKRIYGGMVGKRRIFKPVTSYKLALVAGVNSPWICRRLLP